MKFSIKFIFLINLLLIINLITPTLSVGDSPPEPGKHIFSNQSSPPEPGQRNFSGNNHNDNDNSPSTNRITPPDPEYRKPDLGGLSDGSPRTTPILPNQGTSPIADVMLGDDPYSYSNPPEPGQREFSGNNNDNSPSTNRITPPGPEYRKPDLGGLPDSPRTDPIRPPNQGTSPLLSDIMLGDDPAATYSKPLEPGYQHYHHQNNNHRNNHHHGSNDYHYRKPDLNHNHRHDYSSNEHYRKPDLDSPRTDVVVPVNNDQYRKPDLDSPRTDVVVPVNDQYRRPDLNSPRTDVVVPVNDHQYRNSPRTDVVVPLNNDQYRRPGLDSPRTDIVVPTNSRLTRRSTNLLLDIMQGDDPNPIEPGQSTFGNNRDYSKPLEPGQSNLRRYGQDNEGVIEVPINDRIYNKPSADRVIPVPINDRRPYDSPSTDRILPPNNDRRPYDSPSTDRIFPPNNDRRPYDSPSTDRIIPVPNNDRRPYVDSPRTTPILPNPGNTIVVPNLPERNTIVVPNLPERNTIVVPNVVPDRNYFDPNRPHWQCDMTRDDQCRLENRANFVPFKRDRYLNSPALVLDVTEAIRTRQSLQRLNPVKSYNAGRLVTREYFPANNNRIACLHFSYAWSGDEEKRMHLVQRNRDDKCIYSSHTGAPNDRRNNDGKWQDIELQLDLTQGDSAFLIEFSFDIPHNDNQQYHRPRPYPIEQQRSIIAIRDFKIGYGYCHNNQAMECDLPV